MELQFSHSEHLEREREKWDRHYASAVPADEDASMAVFHAELVERILELVPAGSRILEAGCGAGWQSLALARTGKFDVSLLDFSERALAHARAAFEREGVSAEFILANACDQGGPQYDLVFNAGVLEHYSETEQIALVRGMASRSRRHVMVLVPNRNCYWYWVWRIQNVTQGNWPYGKETPSTDFGTVFREAGLHFLGQAFFASSWSESFVSGLQGIDEPLRAMLVEIHRSPLIQLSQKSYLLAALGSVSAPGPAPPRSWNKPLQAAAGIENDLAAAVAEALALRVGAEERLARLATQLAEKERELERRDRTLEIQRGELEDKKRTIAERDVEIELQGHELVRRQAEIADLQCEVVVLQFEVAHTRSELERAFETARSELAQSRAQTAQIRLEFDKVLALRSYRIMEPLRRVYWHARHVMERARSLRRKAGWIVWKTVRAIGPKIPTSRLKWTARRSLLRHGLRRDSKPWEAELERILAEHRHAKGVVIYPPTLDWQFMFQRPQQLARALARAGYLFLYCTDNTRMDHVEGFDRVEENLFVCHVPWKTFALIENPIVLVTWAVHRSLLQLFERSTIVYDCLDDLEVGATPVQEHEQLLHSADIVLATSGLLIERIRPTRPDVVFCPNAVDYESFAKARTPGHIPDDLQRILNSGKEIVGYHGALARWFDYDLLTGVARAMEHLSFVLVGVDYDGTLKRSGLLDIPNVHWLGLKPYLELPDYLRWFNVGTIPFRSNSITEATSPIKLWECLAAGIPVVSTDLPMCREREGVFIARGSSEFCARIERAIEMRRDNAFRDRLQQTARENTWDARAAQISAALQQSL